MAEAMNFEAGMVVRVRAFATRETIWVVSKNRQEGHVGYLASSLTDPCLHTIFTDSIGAEILSPAPRAGDTWTSGESVARIEANGTQLRIVSDGEPFVGDVVAVARKLWEGGYRFAKRFLMPAMAAPVHVRAPAYATLDDLKAHGLTFDELFARDPIAQALVEQASRDAMLRAAAAVPDRMAPDDMDTLMPAHDEQARSTAAFQQLQDEADVEVARIILGDKAAEKMRAEQQRARAAPDYLTRAVGKGFTVTLPPLSVGSYTLSMDPQAGTVELRGAHSALSGKASVDDLPRAGDVYEHADGTIAEVREREWRYGLRTHVLRAAVACPMLVEADAPEILAALLRQHGYTRRDGKWRMHESRENQRRMELEKVEAIVRTTLVSGASVSEVADAAQRASKGGISQMVREQAQKWIDRGVLSLQHVDFRVHCTDLLDGARSGADASAPCDRATSRKHVDAAVARLRGEPFARAIEAALVGVSERANLTPAEISATIAALRHWEARRPFGVALRPETHAALSRSSAEALRGALGYAPVWDFDNLWFLYERARPHC